MMPLIAHYGVLAAHLGVFAQRGVHVCVLGGAADDNGVLADEVLKRASHVLAGRHNGSTQQVTMGPLGEGRCCAPRESASVPRAWRTPSLRCGGRPAPRTQELLHRPALPHLPHWAQVRRWAWAAVAQQRRRRRQGRAPSLPRQTRRNKHGALGRAPAAPARCPDPAPVGTAPPLLLVCVWSPCLCGLCVLRCGPQRRAAQRVRPHAFIFCTPLPALHLCRPHCAPCTSQASSPVLEYSASLPAPTSRHQGSIKELIRCYAQAAGGSRACGLQNVCGMATVCCGRSQPGSHKAGIKLLTPRQLCARPGSLHLPPRLMGPTGGT
jgi:hypothetical protein